MTVFFIAVFVLLCIHDTNENEKHVVFFILVIVFIPGGTAKKRAGFGTALLGTARHTSDNSMLFNIDNTVKCQSSFSPFSLEIPVVHPSDPDGQLLLFPEEQPELSFDSDYDESDKNKGNHK